MILTKIIRGDNSDLKHHLDDLQSELDTDEKTNLLEHSISEADNLLKTFNTLLYVASIESAAIRDEFTEVSIAQVINDVIELYAPLMEDKQQSLHIDIDSAIIIKGNRELLSQVFANLVDNAIKYTPEKGKITIRSYQDNDGITALEIRDTGIGIPEADKDKVFQRFYRAEKAVFLRVTAWVLVWFRLILICIRLKSACIIKNPVYLLFVICLL